MAWGTILDRNRKYFLIQFLWSVVYAGIAFMLMIVAVLSNPTPVFSAAGSGAEWGAWLVFLSEAAVFLMLTVLYIVAGKKKLPGWNRAYAAVSFGVMLASVPAMLLTMRAIGEVSYFCKIYL